MDREQFEDDFIDEFRALPAKAQDEVSAYLRGLSDPRTRALTLLILRRRLAEHAEKSQQQTDQEDAVLEF